MRLAISAAAGANWFTLALAAGAMLAFAAPAPAGSLEIAIRDPGGRGVQDVVVVAVPAVAGHAQPARAPEATMDQQGRRFVPQVLVVRTGTVVAFPNSDTVSHQVYSFSPARRFQLALYKGEAHPPLTFDKPGLVVLGCNIHDEMIGYIYVTDSPWFAKTGADGTAAIRDVPAGSYRLEVWGPRVADPAPGLSREVTVASDAAVAMNWQLAKPLRPRPSPGPRDVDWDY